MNIFKSRFYAVALGTGLALSCAGTVFADDSEIYLAATPATGVKPNVLLIVDNSGSMGTRDAANERVEYAPGTTYTVNGNCQANRIFFRRKGEAQPDCSSTNYFDVSVNNCQKLANAMTGPSGRWTGKAARFNSSTWTDLLGQSSNLVECSADSGVHGSNSAATPNVYARNGSSGSPWSSLSSASIDWSQRTTYNFYSSNWLNWYTNTPADQTVSRAQAVENAVVNLISSVDDVNMGLMRFNLGENTPAATAEVAYKGGVVIGRVQDIDVNRATLISKITNNRSGGYTASSLTMLSETLYEAYRYWSGGPMWATATTNRDTTATDASGNYISPITSTCSKNYEIILTDGRPTWDNQADTAIASLIGTTCDGPDPGDGGNNPPGPYTDKSVSRAGRCLDDLAGYMNKATTDLAPSAALPGNQNVVTYTIGIGGDVKGADFLDTVAQEGGGKRYDASNSTELLDIFDDITNDVLDVGTTFSTASVSVNAFNRTASRNELYFALFSPEEKVRWDGNLKKYKYAVVDADGPGPGSPKVIITGQGSTADVIASNGFFTTTSQSFWSDNVDGNDVAAGGAANKLPAYTARTMYTFLAANPAGTATNLLPITDSAVDTTLLGVPDSATRTALLDWARAKDEARIGDPMHSVPQVVTYGGPATSPVDVAFVATNDGFLHAVDTADSSGQELWSFIPKELLGRLKPLMDNASGTHTYGLDGDVRILRYDINQDGTIDASAGDRVFLYVGMRRGGQYYYGLDITSRLAPKMLFKIGPNELPGVGETWSPPVVARVNVSGASQNNQKLVLIFGGGYDADQEGFTQVNDGVGNRIFMVDAKSGRLLWSAGSTAIATTPSIDPTFVMASMTNSIPGKITVLDTNADGFADRMYAADTGGRIFRFDITNGNGASTLVAGGVFAALGQGLATGGSATTPDIAETRRFYNAPDVSLIQSRGSASFMAVNIGSGYRGHPLHRATNDRFYSLRDKNPFRKMTQAEYDAFTPLTDASPVDITPNPAGAALLPADMGWKYTLSGGPGEKALSEATTVGGTVLFTTYQPLDPDPRTPCHSQHRNRAYAFNVQSGKPALDLNNDGNITNADLYEVVNHDGILGNVNVVILRGDLLDQYNAACQASGPTACAGEDRGQEGKLICQAGMHIMGRCVPIGDGGRNFWRKQADAGG